MLNAIAESQSGKIKPQTVAELKQELGIDGEEEGSSRRRVKTEPLQPVVIHRVPGFSSQFKEDLGWWFKQDYKKAAKILDMVTSGNGRSF